MIQDRAVRGWRGWALLVGLTGAVTAVMAALSVPSPALFAGLIVATGLALAGRAPATVPAPATLGAQAVIGVVIGVLAQPEALVGLAGNTVPVLLAGVATLAVSMGAGLLMGLRRDVSPLTGMLALTAGGASGLTAISRDLGGDDRVVAVVQYLRVGVVTATMPVVAATVFGATVTGAVAPAGAADTAPWHVDVAFLAVCAGAGLGLARVARVPAGGLLGPMVVALGLSLAGWSFGASPPTLLVELAYAVIGWQAGVRFTRESLRTVLGVLPLAMALIVAVIVACAGIGLLLSRVTGATALEGYLATTPGGVYAVLATAISAGVDVTFVVAVQVLRVIVMLLVAPALARLVGRRARRLSGGRVTVAAMTPIATFSAVALDCREPRVLAEFYSALTGAPIGRAEDDWYQLDDPAGVALLAFQLAPDHVPPQWPSAEHPQQMHLDFDVPDLDEGEQRVLAIGARKPEHQPGTTFRVFLDPAGHPFCLCLE